MKIEKYNDSFMTGYYKGIQMLTAFVFEISSIEYGDNLYGSFTLKVTKHNSTSFPIHNINVCGPDGGNFQKTLSEKGLCMFHPEITHENIIDIFSFEFDQYKISEEIKELQKEQLAYGNQSAALENSETISFEDKKTLRSHYSTKQTQLQERIDKLTLEFSVVDSETIVEQRGIAN